MLQNIHAHSPAKQYKKRFTNSNKKHVRIALKMLWEECIYGCNSTHQKSGTDQPIKKLLLRERRLAQALLDALEQYRESLDKVFPEHYLFKSRKGSNQPISRQRAYMIIKEAVNDLGMDYNISCHSLRKTFGYQAWKNGVQPALLMSIYNHSSYEITKRYLCIDQDERDTVFLNMPL